MSYFLSTAFLLFLVMDPLGNLPFFIATLRKAPPERFIRIIIRESLIAFGVLLLFLLTGKHLLQLMQISEASLGIAGGIILFLIALKMIFPSGPAAENASGEKLDFREPMIVPLAVPMIAGPSSMTMIMLVQGKHPDAFFANMMALLAAWLLSTLILVFGRRIGFLLGGRTLDAGESLMGLILTALATEMLINGIKNAFNMN